MTKVIFPPLEILHDEDFIRETTRKYVLDKIMEGVANRSQYALVKMNPYKKFMGEIFQELRTIGYEVHLSGSHYDFTVSWYKKGSEEDND